MLIQWCDSEDSFNLWKHFEKVEYIKHPTLVHPLLQTGSPWKDALAGAGDYWFYCPINEHLERTLESRAAETKRRPSVKSSEIGNTRPIVIK